jgi:hypothetical protein
MPAQAQFGRFFHAGRGGASQKQKAALFSWKGRPKTDVVDERARLQSRHLCKNAFFAIFF